MLKIGVTGGIGSGKSLVCKIFQLLGVPVYFADDRAKWLMEHDTKLKQSLLNEFGEAIFTEEGRLNRQLLGGLVFSVPEKLRRLEAIVHPVVIADGLAWQEEQAALGYPYTLKEAALLYESGSYRSLDKVVVVSAPEALRLKRVMQRDGATEAAVRARMNKQMPEAEKLALADEVIINDGVQLLIPQVLRLHRRWVRTPES